MGAIALECVLIDQQVKDILTKPLAKGKFEMFRERHELVENTFLGKRECSRVYLR
jgi:hypothetical protein